MTPAVAPASLVHGALEAWPVPLAVTAGDGIILFANRALETAFAYDKEELIGQRLDVVLPGSMPALEAARLGRRMPHPFSGRRKDGSSLVVDVAVNGMRADEELFLVAAPVHIDGAGGERVVTPVSGRWLAPQQHGEALQVATREVEESKARLEAENVCLRQEVRDRLGATRVVARTPAVSQALQQIEEAAATDSTVLLIGETGTGKELFATRLHELSARRGRTMVRVNCAAIPAALIESVLFGRETGAFTGALTRQIGRFELAHQSTIFLDEIGNLPADIQGKLLRVMEQHTVERLGSRRAVAVNSRIVAATHHDLGPFVADGRIREDFYARLNVFPIHLPPLRDRPEDIGPLVWRFVEEFARAFGKRVDSIDRDDFVALQQYGWPGNIRELRNVVERSMIAATGPRLAIDLPSGATGRRTTRGVRLQDVEREHVRAVLANSGWRVRGAGGAAERLGLKPTTLETRMARLGLRRPGRA